MKKFSKGVYPTMVTPFNDDNTIDYISLERFIEKLQDDGSDGLFAVCQSSEMFDLSIEEKVDLASFVVKNSEIDVIASGHTQINLDNQIEEMKRIEQTGVDAVVLISNAFAKENESDDILISNLEKFLSGFSSKIPLGIYECPYPYKRLLTEKVLRFILETNRFAMMKDTSCDAKIIGRRLEIIGDSNFGLYNANAQTIVYSTIHGAAGFSGTPANISTKLVKYIINNPIPMDNFQAEVHGVLYDFATFFGNSEYPVSAKVMLEKMGIFKSIHTRVKNPSLLSNKVRNDAYIIMEKILDIETRL